MQAFLGRLTARCSVEGYVTGNFSAGQAAELAGVVDGLLKVRRLPMGRNLARWQYAGTRVTCLVVAMPAATRHPDLLVQVALYSQRQRS